MLEKTLSMDENFFSHFGSMPITAFTTTIYPLADSANFMSNSAFYQIYQAFIIIYLPLLESQHNLLDVALSEHTITAVFTTPLKQQINNIYALSCKVRHSFISLKEQFAPHTFAIASGMDYGLSSGTLIKSTATNKNLYLWQNNTLTRALKLCTAATTKAYPATLISHEVYTALYPNYLSDFPVCYYYNHICCYGQQLIR